MRQTKINRLKHHQMIAAGLCAAAAIAAPAGASGDGDVTISAEELRTLMDKVDRLESSNAAISAELYEIRASGQEDRMTLRRSDELRAIVEDVLADTQSRASLLGNGQMAGWDGHFFLQSPDDRFRIQLDGQVQARFVANRQTNNPNIQTYRRGFELTRTRIGFGGHIFTRDLEYYIRPETTRNLTAIPGNIGFIRLQDAWFRYRFNDNWALKVGQMKLPYSREGLVSSKYQMGVERSHVNEAMGLGRSQGVQLEWTNGPRRFNIMLSDGAQDKYGVGLLNPPQVNAPYSDPLNDPALSPFGSSVEFAITARYEEVLAGDPEQFMDFTSAPGDDFAMLVGIAAHYQTSESRGVNVSQSFPVFNPSIRDEVPYFAGTADVSLEWGGASAFASASFAQIDRDDQIREQTEFFGVVIQGAMYLSPRLEWYARYEYGKTDFSGTAQTIPDMNVVMTGFNWYLDGHDVKWSNDLGYGITEIAVPFSDDLVGTRPDPITDADPPQIFFRSQFQLLF